MKIVKCIAWVLFAYAGYAAYQVFAIQAPFMDAYICNQVGGSWSCNTTATLNRVTPETYAGYMLPFVVAWLGVAGMMLFGAFRSKKMVYFAFAAAVMLVIVFQYYVPTLHLKPQFDAEQVQKQAQTSAPASTVPSNCPAPTKPINFHIAPGETVAPFSMCGDDILSDDRFDSAPSTPIVMRISLTTDGENTERGEADDEFCHGHSEHLRRRRQQQEKQWDARQALAEFSEFVKREDSSLLPVMKAIAVGGTSGAAAEFLGTTEADFTRMRSRLRELGRCFHAGEQVPRRRRRYNRRLITPISLGVW